MTSIVTRIVYEQLVQLAITHPVPFQIWLNQYVFVFPKTLTSGRFKEAL